MHKAWNDFIVGWKEAQWIRHLALYLLPLISVATLVAYFIERKFSSPPSRLQICLSIFAGSSGVYLARSHSKHNSLISKITSKLDIKAFFMPGPRGVFSDPPPIVSWLLRLAAMAFIFYCLFLMIKDPDAMCGISARPR